MARRRVNKEPRNSNVLLSLESVLFCHYSSSFFFFFSFFFSFLFCYAFVCALPSKRGYGNAQACVRARFLDDLLLTVSLCLSSLQ